jgi:hypothetical protein
MAPNSWDSKVKPASYPASARIGGEARGSGGVGVGVGVGVLATGRPMQHQSRLRKAWGPWSFGAAECGLLLSLILVPIGLVAWNVLEGRCPLPYRCAPM